MRSRTRVERKMKQFPSYARSATGEIIYILLLTELDSRLCNRSLPICHSYRSEGIDETTMLQTSRSYPSEIASSLLSIYGSPVSKRSQGSASRRDESILRHTIARYLNERSSDRFACFTLDDQLDDPIVPRSRRIHSLGTYLDDL